MYLRWAQEVATAHWRAVAPVDAQEQVGWVVLRHEIDYQAAALLGDEVIVRTWVGSAPGVTFERHTEVLRAEDRQLLARARTIWCPINPETARPKRVAAELRARFSMPLPTTRPGPEGGA